MHVTRIRADQRGESQFEDIEIDLSPIEAAPSVAALNISSPVAAAGVMFAQFPPGWLVAWHPAPRRQYWVGILKTVEVTVSNGDARLFGPGSVALLEHSTVHNSF